MRQDVKDVIMVFVMVIVCVAIGAFLGKKWSRPLLNKRTPTALHQREKGFTVNKYYKIVQGKNGDLIIKSLTAKEIVERYKEKNKRNK